MGDKMLGRNKDGGQKTWIFLFRSMQWLSLAALLAILTYAVFLPHLVSSWWDVVAFIIAIGIMLSAFVWFCRLAAKAEKNNNAFVRQDRDNGSDRPYIG